MKTNFNDYILNISNTITAQIKSPHIENIIKLKSQLKSMLNAEDVRLCKYDSYNNKIESLGDKEISATLENSFLEYSINSKEIQFDNYITSNKNYNTSFDNPKKLSIRGLLVYPILNHNRTIGILSVFRSSRQRSNFTKQDKETINRLSPFITAFFENKNFDKSLLNEFQIILKDTPKKDLSKKVEKPKEVNNKEFIDKIKKIEDELRLKDIDIKNSLKQLKVEEDKNKDLNDKLSFKSKEVDSEIDKNKSLILKLETSLKSQEKDKEENNSLNEKLKEKDNQLNQEIRSKKGLETEYQFILENMEVAQKSKLEIEKKYQKVLRDLKLKLSKLEKENIDYIEQNRILEDQYKNYKKIKLEYKSLINDNMDYKEELAEKDNIIKKYKSIEIKNRAKESKKYNKYEVIEHNREYLLTIFMEEFKEYQNAYSMFEMFVYAFSSKNGIDILDNYLVQKELPNLIVSEFYRKKTTNLQEKKYQMQKLFKKISSFEKSIFDNNLKLNITTDENIPMTLIMDIPKLESVIYHILVDFSSFMDKRKSINIEFAYKNKDLIVKIGSFIDLSSSNDGLLKNIFTTNNSIKDTESDRLGFIVAQQTLYILGAKLKSNERDGYYQNSFSLPTKVLNMSMI